MRYCPLCFSNAVSFVLVVLFCGFSYAAPLDLSITNDKVVIKAVNVDLKDILQVISHETGMQVSYLFPETSELISCRIDEPSIVNSLSNLLKNWNYVLVFGENQEVSSNPESLWLVGKVSHQPHSTDMQILAETHVPQDDHIQQLQKNVYTDLFKKDQGHAKQIEVTRVEHSSKQSDNTFLHPPPEQTGIRITALAPDSPFKKIGLHAGDTVYDVNGLQVSSVQDFVDALTSSISHSIIRIERYRDDQTIDPIYIELH